MTPERLCEEYAARVCRFAALVASSPNDAEDIAQEALVKAIRSLDRFDPGRGSMESWLWRIVVNSARDWQRRGLRRLALWQRLADLREEPSEDIEAAALERLDGAGLLAAMRSLSERDRVLIALRIAGLDLASVGRAAGLNEATAGRAVLRALARLRKRLEVHHAEI